METLGRYLSPHGDGTLLIVTVYYSREFDQYYETRAYSQPRPNPNGGKP